MEALAETVVVEIGAEEGGARHVAPLLRACSLAAAPLRCVESRVAEEPAPARLVAIVTFEADGSARVELGARAEEQVAWSARRLRFAPADPPEQRWEAVGLAVGTMARAETSPDRHDPPHEDEPEPLGTATLRGGLDGALVVETGFAESVRAGGALGVRLLPTRVLRFEWRNELAGDRSAVDAVRLDVATWSLRSTLLAGFGVEFGTLDLGLSAGPFVEGIWMHASASGAGSSGAERSRALGGAAATLELRSAWDDTWSVFVAFDVGTRFGATRLAVDGVEREMLPAPFLGARVGVGATLSLVQSQSVSQSTQ